MFFGLSKYIAEKVLANTLYPRSVGYGAVTSAGTIIGAACMLSSVVEIM